MGRVLTFSDDDVIHMASTDFVPVVGDDWYQRRRGDAEGKFWKQVWQQGPRRGSGTKQGMYLFTASGKLLGYRNNEDPGNMRREIERALRKWQALPANERKPGAVTVPDVPKGELDKRFHREPPEGALVLRVHCRVLEEGDKGQLATCTKIPTGVRGIFSSRDHVWILKPEWQTLAPASAKVGQVIDVPDKIAERLCRFHLLDNTRGEPPMWRRQDVRRKKMTLTVTAVTNEQLQMRFDGSALMMTDADARKADRGYDVKLIGKVVFNRSKGRFDRFDVVAVGEHWGDGPYDRGARPGRTPLGIAIELVGHAPVDKPADRVPPQAAREIGAYFGRY